MSRPTFIEVGKIGAAYGIHGWLKIHSFTEYGSSILDYKPWYLSRDKKEWTQYQIEAGKPHGKGVIAKIAGFDTPEVARALTGLLIAIDRAQLPPLKKNEYYWTDLIGLTVIDQNNKPLGTVKYLLETGSNDVLVISGTQEIAIPYLPNEVILAIDLEKKEIHVNWEW